MKKYVNKAKQKSKRRNLSNVLPNKNNPKSFKGWFGIHNIKKYISGIYRFCKNYDNVEWISFIFLNIYIVLFCFVCGRLNKIFLLNIRISIVILFVFFSSGIIMGALFKKTNNFCWEIIILFIIYVSFRHVWEYVESGYFFIIFFIFINILLINLGIFLGKKIRFKIRRRIEK